MTALSANAGLLATRVVAILVLGGEPERDDYAVRLAQESCCTTANVYVSSPGEGAKERLAQLATAGRLRLSFEAVDTVTNFSTMYKQMVEDGVAHVLLVTSPYHMQRGFTLAQIMLAAGGISVEAKPVPGGLEVPHESCWKVWRDSLRAWCWRFTGWDGMWFSKLVKQYGPLAIICGAASILLWPFACCFFLRSARARRRSCYLDRGGAAKDEAHEV
eukprot:TRINITY_DN112397_c0_g1_i1.p1 TRINITY_DN112397_c0_g1~~TRINITY_DN112397_c0_g1_i1.p1  ORF type:complete len:253 (+),score=38.17 TRINITY_DN112397_c0_g1_i1:110-760(+)